MWLPVRSDGENDQKSGIITLPRFVLFQGAQKKMKMVQNIVKICDQLMYVIDIQYRNDNLTLRKNILIGIDKISSGFLFICDQRL